VGGWGVAPLARSTPTRSAAKGHAQKNLISDYHTSNCCSYFCLYVQTSVPFNTAFFYRSFFCYVFHCPVRVNASICYEIFR
ncbi:MAG: hypothetical protein RML94_05205, partial [Bacteroidia bacterium]|nr:hypothetical protein [Bacteroidia bacterium]